MKRFKTWKEITRFAAIAERRPFSVLLDTAVPTMQQATVFYFGGWNMLPADTCAEYPLATFARGAQ